ncbi:MAG: hypothetical protein ACYCWW_03775 [Deltaproteobacteria bacterium]
MPSASASIHGQKHQVRITRDLVDNYAVEVLPRDDPKKRYHAHEAPAALFIYKLKADSWQAAAWTVLQGLKDQGKLDAFESEPVPPKPVRKAAAAAEDDEAAE